MNGGNQKNFRCKLNEKGIERRKIWKTGLDTNSEKKIFQIFYRGINQSNEQQPERNYIPPEFSRTERST
jgi:hypothetical protein